MNNKEWNEQNNKKGLAIIDCPHLTLKCWNEIIKLRKELKKFAKLGEPVNERETKHSNNHSLEL